MSNSSSNQVQVGEIVEQGGTSTASETPPRRPDILETRIAPPARRLVLMAYAPLQAVQSSNFLRYGAYGVQRFGPNAPEHHPPSERMNVHVSIKKASDAVVFAQEALPMQRRDTHIHLDGTNFWSGVVRDVHFYITWVWDFYRLYSGVRLEMDVPPIGAHLDWYNTYQMLRDLQAGDKIIMMTASKAGDLLQVYPVDTPAAEMQVEA